MSPNKSNFFWILFCGLLAFSTGNTTTNSDERRLIPSVRNSSLDSTNETNNAHVGLKSKYITASSLEDDPMAEYTETMLYRLAFDKMDSSKNFLISLKEMKELLMKLQESKKMDRNAEENEEDYREEEEEKEGRKKENTNAVKSMNVLEIRNEIYVYNNENNSSKSDNNGNNNNNNNNSRSSNDTKKHSLDVLARKLTNSGIKYNNNDVTNVIDRDRESSLTIDLFNRVTFHLAWAFNFYQRDTHKQIFYNTPRRTVHRDFMSKDEVFRYARLNELNASAVELRLLDYDHDRHTLLIILPDAVEGLAALERNLIDFENLKDIENRLEDTLVRILLPKFQFNHRIELHSLLNVLKIDAKLKNIYHETAIKVNEDGLGNFRPKTVFFWNPHTYARINPQIFKMNHPFFFVIRNDKNILCLGHVARL